MFWTGKGMSRAIGARPSSGVGKNRVDMSHGGSAGPMKTPLRKSAFIKGKI